MNLAKMTQTNIFVNDFAKDKNLLTQFFNVLKANVVRSRLSIAAVFITVDDQTHFSEKEVESIHQQITLFFQTKVRQTDLLFQLEKPFEWCVILSQSNEKEAEAFLQRLFFDVKNKQFPLFKRFDLSFTANVYVIGNDKVSFEELIAKGSQALKDSAKLGAWQIQYIHDYQAKNIETIKISILEDDVIFRQILHASLENLPVNLFQLEIKAFGDGYDFLQSDWYTSSHTHILIMNDILPRKNGLDVLHTIRRLPNNQKFITFMMTKRKTEEDMIYAYENGVDEYVIKPFNLRLFEAQMKRTLHRLWK